VGNMTSCNDDANLTPGPRGRVGAIGRTLAFGYATPSFGSMPYRRSRSRSRSTSSLKDGRAAHSCWRAALSPSNCCSLSRSTAACSKSRTSMTLSLPLRTWAISWSSWAVLDLNQ
jgi:hypothetical protein